MTTPGPAPASAPAPSGVNSSAMDVEDETVVDQSAASCSQMMPRAAVQPSDATIEAAVNNRFGAESAPASLPQPATVQAPAPGPPPASGPAPVTAPAPSAANISAMDVEDEAEDESVE